MLPARFEADRVFLTAHTAAGGQLTLYTDTGGGTYLTAAAVARLNLTTAPGDAELRAEIGPDARTVPFPALAVTDLIPPPPEDMLVLATAAPLPGWPAESDGMLGQAWFGGHVWTWDYVGRALRLEDASFAPPAGARRVPVEFRERRAGGRQNNFPRITIQIVGETLPMLLDTGAMTVLSDAAMQTIADRLPAARATSMIAQSTFTSWRTKHPDWRFIADAQLATHAAMIEVPSVEIAGFRTGPVWFTSRPDRNFREFMSGMMAGRVEGAIGGNAFHSFVMTVDYPKAVAWFAVK